MMNDLAIPDPNTPAVVDLANPKAGDIRITAGYREAWDVGRKMWRLLPKHCPKDVNPFDGLYQPVQPFRLLEYKSPVKGTVRVWVDANDIRLTKPELGPQQVNTRYYPNSFQFVADNIFKKGENNKLNVGQKTRVAGSEKLLFALAKNDPKLKKYFDDAGKPCPATIELLWANILKILLCAPTFQKGLTQNLVDKATNDPIGFLEFTRKMLGAQPHTQVLMQTNGPTAFKLNIFEQDGSLPDNQIGG